jgi:predicted phosphoribosyltransferase
MSYDYEMRGALFYDRVEAGHKLGEALAAYKAQSPIVLGIPRGGVPVAAALAEDLGAELDVIVAHKLGAPQSQELAIGAVTANGGRWVNERMITELGVSREYLEQETAHQMDEAHRREVLFRGENHHIPLQDRTVIVTDDGLATGATMRAALRSVRLRAPKRLICAVPVGSSEACEAMQSEADEVVCLNQPEPFWAVGVYFHHFQPVPDQEVASILEGFRKVQTPA